MNMHCTASDNERNLSSNQFLFNHVFVFLLVIIIMIIFNFYIALNTNVSKQK